MPKPDAKRRKKKTQLLGFGVKKDGHINLLLKRPLVWQLPNAYVSVLTKDRLLTRALSVCQRNSGCSTHAKCMPRETADGSRFVGDCKVEKDQAHRPAGLTTAQVGNSEAFFFSAAATS